MLHAPAFFTFKTRTQDCHPPQEEDKDEVKVSLALGSPSPEKATITIHHRNFSRHQVSWASAHGRERGEMERARPCLQGCHRGRRGCAIPHPLQHCHETGQDSSRVTRAQATPHLC